MTSASAYCVKSPTGRNETSISAAHVNASQLENAPPGEPNGSREEKPETITAMKFIVQDFKVKPVATSEKLPSFGADSPEKIYEFYKSVVENDPGYEVEKEHVVAICLKTRLTVTGWHMVSVGSLSECTCHPREIFRPVIVRSSHAFVLAHNHPSGDPSPSSADEQITRRIREASELLKISLIDHLIIGEPAPGRTPYYSFREAGLV